MKYEHQIRLQHRHLKAIVAALRFQQRLVSGDVYGTVGRAALDAWEELPIVAHDAYPARLGVKPAVQAAVLESCRSVEDVVWHDCPPAVDFSASAEGRLAAELIAQNKTKARHTRFIVKLRPGQLVAIDHAVELELRIRIGHLDVLGDNLPIDPDRYQCIHQLCNRMKATAWQMEGGNYGPWFSYQTRFLYDIHTAIQRAKESWRYSTDQLLVPNVPLMEVMR